ncbi:MAG TPA: hypothetical protein VF837_02525 [Patescibacteria group bacterium]
MKVWRLLKPKTGKEIPFLIMISFLGTFTLSRIVTFVFPEIFLKVRGIHVHHFSYGIFLLAILGYFLLTQPRTPKTRLRLSLFYGIALGLSMDEFAMWIQLEDNYYNRSSYDAIVLITLILLNIIYFEDFWKKWGYRLNNLFKRIFD